MTYITFRPLTGSDAKNISSLLMASSLDYVRYFQPFNFDVTAVASKLDGTSIDKYFGIIVQESNSDGSELVGFYMLRGMDEGYSDPMYGVFIAQHWQNKGIGRLSLCHAECFCKMNSYKRLLLKVHSANCKAKGLYDSFGFKAVNDDTKSLNILMSKNLF